MYDENRSEARIRIRHLFDKSIARYTLASKRRSLRGENQGLFLVSGHEKGSANPCRDRHSQDQYSPTRSLSVTGSGKWIPFERSHRLETMQPFNWNSGEYHFYSIRLKMLFLALLKSKRWWRDSYLHHLEIFELQRIQKGRSPVRTKLKSLV